MECRSFLAFLACLANEGGQLVCPLSLAIAHDNGENHLEVLSEETLQTRLYSLQSLQLRGRWPLARSPGPSILACEHSFFVGALLRA